MTTSGQQWTHPPFSGLIDEGYVWGRGALDMKGGVAMLASALLRLAAEGRPPAGDITLCLLSVRNLPGMNDIRPFSLEEELAEYRQAKEKTAQMIAEMGSVSGGDSENLKQLALAVMMYSVDYDVMPALDDPETAKAGLIEYVADESAFTDPETGEPYGVNSSISGMSFSEIEDVAKMVVFYQVEPGPDGKRGVAFADGHVQRVSEAEWEELRESSGIE